MKEKLTNNVHSEQLASIDTKYLLSAVASIEQIEEVARQYFEAKYPLMDLTNNEDKCEIDWWDMLQFVQHVLCCRLQNRIAANPLLPTTDK